MSDIKKETQNNSQNEQYRKADYETKEYANGFIASFINMVENFNARFSKYGNPPIYENSTFPWVKEIEDNWEKIREEIDQVMERREDLPSFHEIMPEVKTITTDNNWKTFFLAGYGLESDENTKRCPETMRLLRKIPGMKTAMFSILSPNKHIPAHKGPFNGVLRYHLGLIIPEPKEKCRIRIDKEIKHWNEGESIIFDDTFNHEVWNDTSGFRAVLFVDFVRPVKFPFNLFNKLVVSAAAFAPFTREAEIKHKEWEKKFYKQ
ncbi:MAG: aspartyl/asparaginyl beta-hydroxylase domain-containing protein [Deltaproteobacteria bacterium]|nr:aspartyl/asparaginyl beta-hydroxylase domain-containing protein [Deltaproteobacteria bacterium]